MTIIHMHTQGNDNGLKQQLWEGAMDVKPLMNEADNAAIGTFMRACAKKLRRQTACLSLSLSLFSPVFTCFILGFPVDFCDASVYSTSLAPFSSTPPHPFTLSATHSLCLPPIHHCHPSTNKQKRPASSDARKRTP